MADEYPSTPLVNWTMGAIIALAAFWLLWMTVGRTAAGERG